MAEAKLRLRKWGNSLGIVIPQDVLEKERAKEGDELFILVKKGKPNLRKLFGSYKFKKSTEKIMKEIDRDLYNDRRNFYL